MDKATYQARRFRRELAERSETGAIGFLICTAIVVLAGQGIEAWSDIIVPMGIVIFLVNIGRFQAARIFLRGNGQDSATYFVLKTLIVCNAMMWSFVFLSAYLHENLMGITSLVSLFLTAGYSAGATVSLTPSRVTTALFQTAMIGPLIIVTTYLWMVTGSNGYLTMAGISLAFVFFNFRTSRTFRRDMTDLFSQEFDLMETRKRLAEEQEKLIHSSRLASLGEMAGGLAHEINNPLAILLLGIDSMEGPAVSEQQIANRAAKVKTMRRAILRISKIIRGLRHFSQQGDSLPLESVSIRAIIDETLEFFIGRMEKSSIDYQISGNLEARVHVRPVQISQVLLNLLTNSIDAVSRVAVKKITVKVHCADKQVMIDVSDSGPGLSAGVKERLFLPFVTSKNPGQGMGLGLSISKGIMKEHNGDLLYLADEPQTTFRIVLPGLSQ